MSTSLEDLRMLQTMEMIADGIWGQVIKWETFAKNTVGEQLTRAVDSIGANIAESFGRFHYGEKLKFLYYARGSLFETKYWLNRTSARNLMPSELTQTYTHQLSGLARQINAFANSLKTQRSSNQQIRETHAPYITDDGEEIPLPLFNELELQWLQTLPNDTQSLLSNYQSSHLQSPNL